MLRKTHLLILCCIISLPFTLFSQTSGQTVYNFLRHSPSARLTGLGTMQSALRDNDLALAFSNPAQLNSEQTRRPTFQHQFMLADIGSGMAAYAFQVPKWQNTTFAVGATYNTYGNFKGTDDFGNPTTTFQANDYAFSLRGSQAINERLSVGVALQFISSNLEQYQSVGVAADLGGLYYDTEKKMGFGVTLKNVGTQLTTYDGSKKSAQLPTDLQIAFTKKLAKAPLRFGFILHDLQQWNLRYDSPLEQESSTNFLGEEEKKGNSFGQEVDNAFRHLVGNVEILFGKSENFRLRAAYNHQKRRELTVPNLRSLAGFSFGVGMKVSKFRIDYGYGAWHTAGGVHHLGISTNLRDF